MHNYPYNANEINEKKNVREMGGNARTWKVEERVQS